ncbi:MAG: carboxymuconolactone decarboxylase family protein [Armatimonadetes bacterium]|nr:carboxymuconolactone decarboxylase family protein [Armatimonadota bacterium]
MGTLHATETPTGYQVHDTASAREGVREILEGAQKQLGFVPNLYGVFAEAPAALTAYSQLGELFGSTSLSPIEQNVVLLSVSAANGCDYCMAAHTAIANMANVPQDVIEALRSGKPIADPKLQALRAFTQDMTLSRGRPNQESLEAFSSAGYTRRNALEVNLGITMKTLSNYTNHLAETPLDEQFKSFEWSAR